MKLAVVIHRFDRFRDPPPAPGERCRDYYLLGGILDRWAERGHAWELTTPDDPIDADAAFLHVDGTVIAEEYSQFAARYGVVVNGRTTDISKRTISRNLVQPGSDWTGQVICKSNLNNSGQMELLQNERAMASGHSPLHQVKPVSHKYAIFRSVADVPDAIWNEPQLVIEKFLPESNGDGSFTLRTYTFLGPRERCTRLIVPNNVSKASDILRHEVTEVPAGLRLERERLGFDYGKFDFVMYDGVPVLLDANRTPGNPRLLQDYVEQRAKNLAEGLDLLLRGASAA